MKLLGSASDTALLGKAAKSDEPAKAGRKTPINFLHLF